MDFDFADLSPGQRYKLLASLVVPRPIALVTTRDAEGVVNAAPYSFFNVFGVNPGLVILNVGDRPEGGPKDTAANVSAGGRFVVNLVDEPIAVRMNAAAIDFPPGTDELAAVGLTAAACPGTDVPRVAESPASLACREHSTQRIGGNRIILGEVTAMHCRDGLVDPETLRVDLDALTMVGRMASPGWYARTTDRFELPRETYEEWRRGRDATPPRRTEETR